MLPRECPGPVLTPRQAGLYPVLGALILALAGPAAPQAILPPDAAVKAYQAGVDAAGRREWPAVVRRMDEALATGHREPRRNFGTTRNYVDLYDPWYWRGVARMELGEDETAREDLVRSRDAGVIRTFPEFSDLLARLAATRAARRDRRGRRRADADGRPDARAGGPGAARRGPPDGGPRPGRHGGGRGRARSHALLGRRLRRSRGGPRGPAGAAP